MERFPKLKRRCESVLKDGMFSVADLPWIAPCLETSIRLTMEDATYEKIKDFELEVEKDCIFGNGPITVHMLFSWVSIGSRLVGHFDLLQPSDKPLFSLRLLPDVAWHKE